MAAAILLAIVVLATASAASADAPATLCEAGERVYFSCATAPRGRIASLCGSADLGGASGYLQYRFGRPGAVELAFPSARAGSLHRFRYDHYLRPLVDRQGVWFVTGGYRYEILHHREAETTPEEVYAGVEVTPDVEGTSPRAFPCRGPVRSELIALEGVVPCDPANALGGCAE